MKKTAEMIEEVLKHVEKLLNADHLSPELQRTALSLREHLKADLLTAEAGATLQQEVKKPKKK
jgi:hypothetical protein